LFFFRVVVDALVVAGCHPEVTRGHRAVCPSVRVQRWLSYSYSRWERIQRNIPSQSAREENPAVGTRVCWVPAAGLHTRIPAQHPRT